MGAITPSNHFIVTHGLEYYLVMAYLSIHLFTHEVKTNQEPFAAMHVHGLEYYLVMVY